MKSSTFERGLNSWHSIHNREIERMNHRRSKRALDCDNYCIFVTEEYIIQIYNMKQNLLPYLIVRSPFIVISLL